MKRFVLEKSLGIVRNYYPEYDDDTMDRISYGLEALYLSITKLTFIFITAYLLGILKESIFLCLTFNILRASGFGLHASKSWMCWISSSIVFLIIPYFARITVIPKSLLILLALICEINLLIFAPADTEKRPLINKKKRAQWKLTTVCLGVIFIYFILRTRNNLVQNILFSAMLIESALVNPVVYRLFRLPYNNYKRYVYSTKEKEV